jgi:hypothetical protein
MQKFHHITSSIHTKYNFLFATPEQLTMLTYQFLGAY